MKKLILFLIVSVLLINLVNAFEFDNVKTYDEVTRTVTFENSIIGIPTTKISEVKLLTPLTVTVIRGKDRKVAEFELNLYQDYDNFLKQMEFYNIRSNNLKIDRNFKLKYAEVTGVHDVLNSKTECQFIQNKTTEKLENVCNEVYFIEKEETIEWKELDYSKLTKGVYKIGVFADVEENDRVEWIPTMFSDNLKVSEWASWEEGFNTDLLIYYNFETGTGTAVYNNVNTSHSNATLFNGSSYVTTGKIGNGTWYDGSDDSMGITGYTNYSWFWYQNQNVTINFWVNLTTSQPQAGNNPTLFDRHPTSEWLSIISDDSNVFRWSTNTPARVDTFCTTDLTDNTWKMITVQLDRGSDMMKFYVNGVLEKNLSGANTNFTGIATASYPMFMAYTPFTINSRNSKGTLDEVGIWVGQHLLSASEISSIYNSGSGMTYNSFLDSNVSLNTPIDDTYTNNNSIVFNCSVTGVNIINLSLILDSVINYTLTNSSAGLLNLSLQTILNVSEGTHNWDCNSTNLENTRVTAVNNDLYVDNTNPTIIINSPLNGTETVSSIINSTLNATSNDLNGISRCWYSNTTAN